MKKTLKKSKGITLIALVITIVILLILAGISISALTQTGLFGKAKQAEQKSKEAQKQEDAILSSYENALNTYFLKKADGSWDSNKKVNSPQLMDGMIPVYWDEDGKEVKVTAENENNWYDYENKEWANAKTQDGSYWVWIPRYAYKIESGCYTNQAGAISIKFLQGTSNKDSNNSEINTTYPEVNDGVMQGFVVHPSFTDGNKTAEEIANGEIPFGNGEWRKNIAGYWVAKYAAGFQASTTDASDATKVVNGSDKIVYSSAKYTTNNGYTATAIAGSAIANTAMSYPVFKPLTYAYNFITTGESYTLSKEIATASSFYGLNSGKTDSHQMKNSEWGAVAYLAQSSCGRNNTEVSMNSKNLNNLNSKNIYAVTGYSGETANGVDASTTNNMTGVFDMRGCVWERTAAYVTNGEDNLKYGSSYVASTTANAEGYKTLSTEYATVYPYDSARLGETYNSKKSSTYGFGDAILETSGRTTNKDGWNEDFSGFPYSTGPFFLRGGYFGDAAAGTGSFAFSNTSGAAHNNYGFRSVLVAL